MSALLKSKAICSIRPNLPAKTSGQYYRLGRNTIFRASIGYLNLVGICGKKGNTAAGQGEGEGADQGEAEQALPPSGEESLL